jgi:hypothetical protein
MDTSLDGEREEINTFRLFERQIDRWSHKIRGGGRGRKKLMNKNVQGDTGFIRMGRHFMIYKTAQLRCYGHIERMNNERLPKQIVIARIVGIRERRRPRKI